MTENHTPFLKEEENRKIVLLKAIEHCTNHASTYSLHH